MNDLLKFYTVTVVLLTLFACASFTYQYYGIIPSKGVLLGKTPKEDQPLTVCEPDDQVKGKCVVLFTPEFERLRADLIDAQERLKACEGQ
jgi:hypothetical protein